MCTMIVVQTLPNCSQTLYTDEQHGWPCSHAAWAATAKCAEEKWLEIALILMEQHILGYKR